MKNLSVFCRKTADEEHRCIHKLLGDKFRVGIRTRQARRPCWLISSAVCWLEFMFIQDGLDTLLSLLSGCEELRDARTQDWLSPSGFRSLLALIGTNGQGIGTRYHMSACSHYGMLFGQRESSVGTADWKIIVIKNNCDFDWTLQIVIFLCCRIKCKFHQLVVHKRIHK